MRRAAATACSPSAASPTTSTSSSTDNIIEKPEPGQPTSSYYNAGIYAFSPLIYEYTAKLELSPRGEYELTDALRDLAVDGKKLRAIELSGEWADVRDPEVLKELNED